ncbi:NYN domain-containing protein [Phaeobacter sp. BS23]
MFYKDERLALFIDGSNLYAAAKALGFDIDYKLLRQEFMRRGKLLRAFYYTALLENDEYSPIRPLVDWLHYNGFTMVTKPAKEYTDSMGRRKVKGNMDIELTVDAMELAPRVDHIVLFSGDGDFRPLIASLQRQGVRVSVVSTIRSQPPMISDELRRQADNFIELEELKDVIGRPPANKAIRVQCRPQAADTNLVPMTRFGHGRHSPQQCSPLSAGFCLRSARHLTHQQHKPAVQHWTLPTESPSSGP